MTTAAHLTIESALAIVVATLAVALLPKPAADASPVIASTPVSVAPAAVPPTAAQVEPAPASSLPGLPGPTTGAGFEFVDCSNGSCGPAGRLAAPVRFVGRAVANRPRLLGRIFRGRR